MSIQTPIILSCIIIVLAFVAACFGILLNGEQERYPFQTLYGATVEIQGAGLYAHDTVSMAAQAKAQDAVTLFFGIPVLLLSLILFAKKSLKGQLLLAGILGYFLYTYASYAFGASYNSFFLIYVALFSLSLFSLIAVIQKIEIAALPGRFSSSLPRRFIAVFLFILCLSLLMAWVKRIVTGLSTSQPPEGLESYTTLFIQGLDLGVVVPVSLIAGIQLLRKRPWGYLLSSIILVNASALALAVSAMAVNMIRTGITVNAEELILFPALAVFSVALTIIMVLNIQHEKI